jgi:protein-tyrosine phosphatase
MALIGISILTTWQHHFIDLPTGCAVGFLALWLLPDSLWSAGILPAGEAASCRLEAAAGSRRSSRLEGGAPLRLRIALLYTIAAIVFALAACRGGAWLWLVWVATALALVAWNYGVAGAAGFQKQSDGRLSAGAYGLLVPYLAGAWLNSRLWTWRGTAAAEIADGVSIGRIPTWREFAATPFLALVDVVAELPCRVRGARFYRSIPILDLTVPPPAPLKAAAEAIEEARAHGPVLVCCALGYSRSAAVVVAWLLLTGRAPSVEAAMEILRRARPAVVLKHAHRVALEAIV